MSSLFDSSRSRCLVVGLSCFWFVFVCRGKVTFQDHFVSSRSRCFLRCSIVVALFVVSAWFGCCWSRCLVESALFDSSW